MTPQACQCPARATTIMGQGTQSNPRSAVSMQRSENQDTSPDNQNYCTGRDAERQIGRGSSRSSRIHAANTTFTGVWAARHVHPDRQSILERVLDSNECRLDRLDSQGIEFNIDGVAVLPVLLQRTLASRTNHDFKLNWALNVAGLLDQVETQTLVTRVSLNRQHPSSADRQPSNKAVASCK